MDFNVVSFGKKKVSDFLMLLFIGLAFYIPLFLFTLQLSAGQKMAGDDPRFVLPVYGSDSVGYVVLADHLLEKHVFTGSNHPPYFPETYRTPVYPLLLAIFKAFTGSYVFFPAVQFLFVVGSAFIILRAGERLFGRKVGLVSAFLFMFDPTTVFHTLVILSEISYVFFILLSLYVLFPNFRSNDSRISLGAFYASGFILGFATLLRPVSMFLPIVFAIFYVCWQRRENSWKVVGLRTVIFLLGFCTLVFPWVVRNRLETGAWGLSSAPTFGLFFYAVPEFLSYKENTTPDVIRLRMAKDLPAGIAQGNFGSLEYSGLLQNLSLKYLKGNIISYSEYHIVKTIPVFLSPGLRNVEVSLNDIFGAKVFDFSTANMTNLLLHGKFAEFFGELKRSFLITAEMIFLFLVSICAIIAFARKRTRTAVFFFWIIILYFSLLTGPAAYARFRLPIAPFLFLLAVFGATIVWRSAERILPKFLGFFR